MTASAAHARPPPPRSAASRRRRRCSRPPSGQRGGDEGEGRIGRPREAARRGGGARRRRPRRSDRPRRRAGGREWRSAEGSRRGAGGRRSERRGAVREQQQGIDVAAAGGRAAGAEAQPAGRAEQCRGRRRGATREPAARHEPPQAEVGRHQRAAAHADRQPAARERAGEGHPPRAGGAHDGSGARRHVDAAALPARERRARGETWNAPTTGPRSGQRQPVAPAAWWAATRAITTAHAKASEARTRGCGRGGIGRRYGRAARRRPAARDLLQSLREAVTVRAERRLLPRRSSCDTTQAARRGQSR